MASRADMNSRESQTRLGMGQRGERVLHVAVDGVVSQREDQHEPEQRDRQERDRRLGEADDQPRPLGVGDLLHRRERHAAAGEAGEVEPVDVEELPGAIRVFAAERPDEEDQPEDGESAADAEEQVVPARTGPARPGARARCAGSSRPPSGGAGRGRAGRDRRRGAGGLLRGGSLRLQLAHVIDDRPAVGRGVDLVAVARHDAAAVADDAVDVPVAIRRGPGWSGATGRRSGSTPAPSRLRRRRGRRRSSSGRACPPRRRCRGRSRPLPAPAGAALRRHPGANGFRIALAVVRRPWSTRPTSRARRR